MGIRTSTGCDMNIFIVKMLTIFGGVTAIFVVVVDFSYYGRYI
jgi:hypothetical protein